MIKATIGMSFNPLSSDLAFVWDLVALFISFMAIMVVVQINGVISKKKLLPSSITRKLIHLLVGPLYIITWLLYSGEWFSRVYAAVVPLIFVLMFYAIGSGKMKNEAFVDSMSRSGDAKELLRGTLDYAAILLLVTLVWFFEPLEASAGAVPIALIVFGCLAGGDGFADIIGRKFGKHKYSEKSVEGSIGMFVGSMLFCLILVGIFSLSISAWDLSEFILPLVVFSIVATIVEAVSPKNLDNWMVAVSVLVVMALLNWLTPDFWPYTLFGGLIG